MRPVATALALGVCLTLAPLSDALSSNPLGASQALNGVPATLVLQIKNDKQQKAKNKSCPPGKVFVEDKGCMDRDRAEKRKEKEKEKEQKAKQTPPPPPPPPVKSDCRNFGPNEGSAGSSPNPKEKYECEPLGGGNKRCCWVKYP